MPIVTIGVCARNRERLIGNAIKSIAEQDYPKQLTEIIFVDDGSTDRTLFVIKEHVQKLKLKAKIFHQEWKGIGASRNFVVNNATGKYIIWVDSDMQLSRDFVKMQTNFMEKNPNVGVAKGSYGLYDANLVSTLENLEFVTTNSERMRELDRNPLGTGGCIYRVKAINEVGGFNESITGSGEDADAEHRLKKKGWIFEQTNAVFFEMRRTTWQSLWEEYFWHGKGSLRITRGQTPTTLFKFLPPVALFVECIRIVVAYKLTRRKIAILLPFHYAFKRTAWLAGLLHARFS